MNKEVKEVIESVSMMDNKWIVDNMILFVRSGSHAYGTNTEESDRDYKGVFIPPLNYHLGIHDFTSITMNTSSNDKKNSSDDIDVTIYSLKEFFRLAMKGNPNILEMLFVEQEDILYASNEGVVLGLNREHFLSTNNIKRSFGGFANSAKSYMDKPFGLKEDVARTKTYHSIRVYEMAVDALTTGKFKAKSDNPEYLKEIRGSGTTLESLMGRLGAEEEEFKRAVENSILNDELDKDSLEKMLIIMTMNHLNLLETTSE